MNRINETGIRLIEYKCELQKNHSGIVRDSLITSLELLLHRQVIDEAVLSKIKDDSPIEEFESFLAKYPKYRKSPREMYREYDVVRQELDVILERAGFTEGVETEISTEFNRITVLRCFSIDKGFIMDYFGVTEKDLIQLMKKRDFAEKFAILRMNKVFDEIKAEMRPVENIVQDHSLVYYNRPIMGFSIDYKYHIGIDFLANYDNMQPIVKKIIDLDNAVDRKFRRKIGIELYQKDPKSKSQDAVARPPIAAAPPPPPEPKPKATGGDKPTVVISTPPPPQPAAPAAKIEEIEIQDLDDIL